MITQYHLPKKYSWDFVAVIFNIFYSLKISNMYTMYFDLFYPYYLPAALPWTHKPIPFYTSCAFPKLFLLIDP